MPGAHGAWPRRRVVRALLSAAAAVPLAGAFAVMLRRERLRRAPAAVSIPPDFPAGLSIIGSAVVSREPGGRVRAFAARCTHLGCRLDRVAGDRVVCPCHGSRFRPDGSIEAGPTSRPLTPLRLEPDPATGGWIVHVT